MHANRTFPKGYVWSLYIVLVTFDLLRKTPVNYFV